MESLFLKRTGYVYELYHRVRVNRRLEAGLIAQYLADHYEPAIDIRRTELLKRRP